MIKSILYVRAINTYFMSIVQHDVSRGVANHVAEGGGVVGATF